MKGNHRAPAIMIVCALLFGPASAPRPASAEVNVTVEVAVGGTICAGAAVLIYISASREFDLISRAAAPYCLCIRGREVRWGLPTVGVTPSNGSREGPAPCCWELGLLRWEF